MWQSLALARKWPVGLPSQRSLTLFKRDADCGPHLFSPHAGTPENHACASPPSSRPRARRAGPGRALGDGVAPGRWINDARLHGLRQLRFSSRLAEGADEGLTPCAAIPSTTETLRTGMGEVIAWGTCDWFRPGRAVRMWLRSSGHRELVLRRGPAAPSAPAGRVSVAKHGCRDGRRSVPFRKRP